MNAIEQLKNFVHQYINSKAPGMYQLLDLLAKTRYHVGCLDLLFSSPSRLYMLILGYYHGDTKVADIVFQILFINPIALYLRRQNIISILMEFVKLGKDKEFLDLLASSI